MRSMEDEIYVNRKPIDQWIYDNRPDGLSKLAVESKVPADTIGKVRRGKVPPEVQRGKLADALKIQESEIFPRKRVNAVS